MAAGAKEKSQSLTVEAREGAVEKQRVLKVPAGLQVKEAVRRLTQEAEPEDRPALDPSFASTGPKDGVPQLIAPTAIRRRRRLR